MDRKEPPQTTENLSHLRSQLRMHRYFQGTNKPLLPTTALAQASGSPCYHLSLSCMPLAIRHKLGLAVEFDEWVDDCVNMGGCFGGYKYHCPN